MDTKNCFPKISGITTTIKSIRIKITAKYYYKCNKLAPNCLYFEILGICFWILGLSCTINSAIKTHINSFPILSSPRLTNFHRWEIWLIFQYSKQIREISIIIK
jgi:hypothetical protein